MLNEKCMTEKSELNGLGEYPRLFNYQQSWTWRFFPISISLSELASLESFAIIKKDSNSVLSFTLEYEYQQNVLQSLKKQM